MTAAALGPTYVYLNANIITMDPRRPSATAIAIAGDEIVAVGSNGEVARLARSNTRIVDLDGYTIIPGIVDAHGHLLASPQQRNRTHEQGQNIYLDAGITTTGQLAVMPWDLPRLQAFKDAGKLVVRVNAYLAYVDVCGGPMDEWWANVPVTHTRGELLRIAGVKIFADGGACNHPAVSQEFSPGQGLGNLYFSTAEMTEMVRKVDASGRQVVIHAIGDRAVRVAQDAIIAVLNGRPNTLRHRIDHNALVPPDLVGRYSQYGIIPVVFGFYHPGLFEPPDPATNDGCPAAPRNAYFAANEGNTRRIIDANPFVPVAWHGDDPSIPPAAALRELYNMVTRIRQLSWWANFTSPCPPDPWLAATAVTPREALTMMTINAAYALGRETEVGSLEPGKFADLLILTTDPLVHPELLSQYEYNRPALTMIGGRVVYCRSGHEAVCVPPKSGSD